MYDYQCEHVAKLSIAEHKDHVSFDQLIVSMVAFEGQKHIYYGLPRSLCPLAEWPYQAVLCTCISCMWWIMQDVKSSKTTFINRTQQCFAVRSGVDGILDLARSTFCRVTEQVHELVDKYKAEYGMDALKVRLIVCSCLAD